MRTRRSRLADLVVGAVAMAALVAGGVIIGLQRARYTRYLYVSELGAQGSPTADHFRWGFVCVVVGIALVSWILRDVRSEGFLLSLCRPALTLAAAAGCFLVASQVTCSKGCPLAFTPAAAPNDAVHIIAAVAGFAAGALAMLQFATAPERRTRRISVVSGLLVAVIAGTGGLLSLADTHTDLGSTLEYVATGIGLGWLVTITAAHLWQGQRASPVALAHNAAVPLKPPPSDPAWTGGSTAGLRRQEPWTAAPSTAEFES